MIVVADITAWLTSLGLTTPAVDGYWVPPDPDRLILIMLAGGPGLLYERAYDRQAVTLRSRGLQRQPADAEALATQVDDLILSAVPPVTVGSKHVNDIDRLSPPRFASADKALRSEFTATYLLTFAR